jgi:hypothetical protein
VAWGVSDIDHQSLQFLADGRLVTGWGAVLDGRPLSEALQVEREALGVVRPLRRLPRSRAEIIAAIEADPSISEEVRQRAIAAASDLSDESSGLVDQCWEVLAWPHRPSSILEMVERTGAAILRSRPREPWGRAVRGAALYRLGRDAESAGALPDAADLPERLTPPGWAERTLIYRALTLARLGRDEEARTILQKIDPDPKTNPLLPRDVTDLWAEAGAVIPDSGFPVNPFAQ